MATRPRWILDGAPYYADELVYAAADTVVFLDYPKALVLWRVLQRTASIEVLRRPAGAHRPQGLSALRDREHPLRWAWISHGDRHREGLALMARPGPAQTQILRFTHPSMARRWCPSSNDLARPDALSWSWAIFSGRCARVGLVCPLTGRSERRCCH